MMSSTASPSLHRLVARRALETTAFGYEVIASSQYLNECIATVEWADSWCPDAAQFVLIQAPGDLTAPSARRLIPAVRESHLRPKLRLVCNARTLEDDELVAILRRNEIGFLLQTDDPAEIESLATAGILGVRVDQARTLAGAERISPDADARQIVATAHDLGLRSIASQAPKSEDVARLLGLGFDYVSLRDAGFVPAETNFAWQRRVV